MKTYSIQTDGRDGLFDITDQVREAISTSGVSQGECLVYCPHTTAGVTINENADPNVMHDLTAIFDRLVPWEAGYRHAEGNSAAHAKSSMVGCSARVIVKGGRPVLGTWQSVFFCEFDGPRNRKFHVQVMGS
jgi:secondary thiamine-phosphate synthase enzyme